jgi:hypothetical protein
MTDKNGSKTFVDAPAVIRPLVRPRQSGTRYDNVGEWV